MPLEQNGYSQAQILAMQNDAIRRVNEMQRISQSKIAGGAPPPMQNKNQRRDSTQRGIGTPPMHFNSSQTGQTESHGTNFDTDSENLNLKSSSDGLFGIGNTLDSILKSLDIDKEQLLILVLLFLLMKEDADQKMILALIYILM